MLDARNGQTIIGWDIGDNGEAVYLCDSEAENWIIDWIGTEPPDSAWATMCDRRDYPPFRVWPLHLNTALIPEGAICEECGAEWNGREWVSYE